MKIQFAPEITIGLGSVLLALKNRSSYLRIQARAPRSLKNPKSKQGCAENIEAMEPIVTKAYCLGLGCGMTAGTYGYVNMINLPRPVTCPTMYKLCSFRGIFEVFNL